MQWKQLLPVNFEKNQNKKKKQKTKKQIWKLAAILNVLQYLLKLIPNYVHE